MPKIWRREESFIARYCSYDRCVDELGFQLSKHGSLKKLYFYHNHLMTVSCESFRGQIIELRIPSLLKVIRIFRTPSSSVRVVHNIFGMAWRCLQLPVMCFSNYF